MEVNHAANGVRISVALFTEIPKVARDNLYRNNVSTAQPL
jgi:hypothetical protein